MLYFLKIKTKRFFKSQIYNNFGSNNSKQRHNEAWNDIIQQISNKSNNIQQTAVTIQTHSGVIHLSIAKR